MKNKFLSPTLRTTKNNITLKNTKTGQGVFANKTFNHGDTIFTFKGILCNASTGSLSPNSLQIDKKNFIEPYKWNAGRYINHSCSPNAGIKSPDKIVAMRKIPTGEEIVIDYAIAIFDDKSPAFKCRCGASKCRSIISGPRNRKHLPKLLKKYDGFIPSYLKNACKV